MISVVIPTLNAQATLTSALAALVPAAVQGMVREVIVVDGGSTDATALVADGAGAQLIRSDRGRGAQLSAGVARARFPWLLCLHADTVLEAGWEHAAAFFIGQVDSGRYRPAAGAFRFALDDLGWKPRLLEQLVSLRCSLFRLPYGDQGLLIPKQLYEDVGGYRPWPLMEDVDLACRLGRRRIYMLGVKATTSADRFRREGYMRRAIRNLACLALFKIGVSPSTLARFYTGRRAGFETIKSA
jgi:rSAM/selenodomain-associated transferase 2